jgi:hypothetical protein
MVKPGLNPGIHDLRFAYEPRSDYWVTRWPWHVGRSSMSISMTHENLLYFVIGALILLVAVLVYQRQKSRTATGEIHIRASDANILIESI